MLPAFLAVQTQSIWGNLQEVPSYLPEFQGQYLCLQTS